MDRNKPSKARDTLAGLRRTIVRTQPKAADRLPAIKKMKAKPMDEAQPKPVFTPVPRVRKPTAKKNFLTVPEAVRVTNILYELQPKQWVPSEEPGYVALLPGGMDDAALATYLTDRLGFPVTEKNVSSLRDEFFGKMRKGIPRAREVIDPALVARIEALEREVLRAASTGGSTPAPAPAADLSVLHDKIAAVAATAAKARSEARAALKKIEESNAMGVRILANLERMEMMFTTNVDIKPLARMFGEFNHLKTQVAEIIARGYVAAPTEDPDIARARLNRAEPILPSERTELSKEDIKAKLGERFKVTPHEGKQT